MTNPVSRPGTPAVPTRALVLLALLAIAWGTFWPASKFVLGEIPLLTFRALCGEIGGASLLVIALLNGHRLTVPRRDLPQLLLVALFNTSGWLYFSGMAVMTMGAGRAALIAYTMPFWAFLLGIWLLGERPTARRWLGLAIGLAGIVVLVTEDVERILAHPAGAAASIVGAMSWATGSVLFKRRTWAMSELPLVGWQQFLGGLPLALAAVLTESDRWIVPSGPVSAMLVYNIAAGTVFGVWAWFRIVRLLPIALATLGVLAVPVVGLVSSALFLGEPVTLHVVAAMALILAGLTTVLPLPRIPSARRWRRPGTGMGRGAPPDVRQRKGGD